MVESLGRGRYLHSGIRESGFGIRGDQGDHRIAFAVADGPRTWVFIDGRTFIVADREPEARHASSQADDLVALSAPMPATVIAVEAVPGQEVQAGDDQSRELFSKLLKDEEEHVDWLEAQVHQMKEMGYERYLTLHVQGEKD